MTIKQIRTLLGNEATNFSDEELKRDLEIAEILKSIFFDLLKQNLLSKSIEK